jgi:hypothetical protein
MSPQAPSVPTMKRLYALSGNQCAFPNCTIPLVDADSGKVTGRVCHIKGNRVGAKRYDPHQTDVERHGFDNLVLMCPVHHDVIDADEQSYTVERLSQIKRDHEATTLAADEPPDEIAERLLVNASENTVTEGSIITSINQMGGQVAHSITNVGPQPRRISRAAGNVLVSTLRDLPPENFDITSMMGNTESEDLADVLNEVLTASGWSVGTQMQAMYNAAPRQIIVSTQKDSLGVSTFLRWLDQVGLQPQSSEVPFGPLLSPNPAPVHVVVGQGM